jgi:hypothetical protein
LRALIKLTSCVVDTIRNNAAKLLASATMRIRGYPCFAKACSIWELFKRTAHFCEKYDAAAFDPDAQTLPQEFFEPMVRRVFAEPKQTLYKAAFEKMG